MIAECKGPEKTMQRQPLKRAESEWNASCIGGCRWRLVDKVLERGGERRDRIGSFAQYDGEEARTRLSQDLPKLKICLNILTLLKRVLFRVCSGSVHQMSPDLEIDLNGRQMVPGICAILCLSPPLVERRDWNPVQALLNRCIFV